MRFLKVGFRTIVLRPIALLLAVIILPSLVACDVRRPNIEANVRMNLEVIVDVQEHFRHQDVDANGKKDYWRADVAGLYALEVKGKALKLIEESAAAADDRPVTNVGKLPSKSPKARYWYRTLRFPGEKKSDPDRFAVCAFPNEYGSSDTSTYIVSDKAVIYKKDLGHGDGLEFYPADPPAEGWEVVPWQKNRPPSQVAPKED